MKSFAPLEMCLLSSGEDRRTGSERADCQTQVHESGEGMEERKTRAIIETSVGGDSLTL